MKCPSCQRESPPAAKFCLECGTRLRLTCATCGVELPPAAKFCLECGVSLVESRELRVESPPSLHSQLSTVDSRLPSETVDSRLLSAPRHTRRRTSLRIATPYHSSCRRAAAEQRSARRTSRCRDSHACMPRSSFEIRHVEPFSIFKSPFSIRRVLSRGALRVPSRPS